VPACSAHPVGFPAFTCGALSMLGNLARRLNGMRWKGHRLRVKPMPR